MLASHVDAQSNDSSCSQAIQGQQTRKAIRQSKSTLPILTVALRSQFSKCPNTQIPKLHLPLIPSSHLDAKAQTVLDQWQGHEVNPLDDLKAQVHMGRLRTRYHSRRQTKETSMPQCPARGLAPLDIQIGMHSGGVCHVRCHVSRRACLSSTRSGTTAHMHQRLHIEQADTTHAHAHICLSHTTKVMCDFARVG